MNILYNYKSIAKLIKSHDISSLTELLEPNHTYRDLLEGALMFHEQIEDYETCATIRDSITLLDEWGIIDYSPQSHPLL